MINNDDFNAEIPNQNAGSDKLPSSSGIEPEFKYTRISKAT